MLIFSLLANLDIRGAMSAFDSGTEDIIVLLLSSSSGINMCKILIASVGNQENKKLWDYNNEILGVKARKPLRNFTINYCKSLDFV